MRPASNSGSARRLGARRTVLRRPPDQAGMLRRRRVMKIAKLALPATALLLLTAIVLWPQLEREIEVGRGAVHRMGAEVDAGRLTDAKYRGVDQRGRPYAFTATTAIQVTPERVDLTAPKGDLLTESGSWVLLRSDQGVYLQHTNQLDLSGHVVLYRDDGTTLRSATAAIDLKQGAAAGADTVSAEGPFGTLDATGFALVDKGEVIRFAGPARLVLNGDQK